MSGIRISEKHGVNPMLVVCFFCGQDRGDIALLGRLPNDKEAPHRGVLDYEPCDKCKAQMATGITLIESTDGKTFTGRWAVVTEQCVNRVFDAEMAAHVLKHRKAFIDPAAANKLGLFDIEVR